MAIVADHPVTPSNAVDQAWHFHLTYTHSYRDDLCAQILPRSLHHYPTQGGQQQRELFWDCYSKTLDSYKRFFGYCAPADIWPAPATRFRQAGQFRQVNSQNYWMIPKPSFALARRVLLNISHQSWLRVVVAALLTIGLVFSLDFLCHSAIASDLYWINIVTSQPAVAQVSSPPNSYVPAYPEVEPTSYSGWIWWIIAGFFLIFCFISAWIDSRCPICKRFWLVEATTRVLRERTEQTEGEKLITKRCKCCNYIQERHETIPRGTDSDFGCACV